MAILLRSDAPPPARDYLVFGSGAIGGAILRRLRHRAACAPLKLHVPWTEPAARKESLGAIGRAVEERAREREVHVIWAAGKAGFSATEDDAAGEFAGYTDVIEMVRRMSAPHALHMVSSAGGLYEGRTVRSAADQPSPIRPYGHLKVAQEQLAFEQLPDTKVAVYRPSSVYSVPGQGGRPGLIGALVHNGIAQRPSTIIGALDTLRDYVMASDVGAYVADRALDGPIQSRAVFMLVDGHPASILQVITAVETVLRRRLYIRMAESWNARNITFSPAARADRFASTPLDVGIRLVHSAALGLPIAA